MKPISYNLTEDQESFFEKAMIAKTKFIRAAIDEAIRIYKMTSKGGK